jgi:pimeloyl-ACP methyl ester carboxylesterase
VSLEPEPFSIDVGGHALAGETTGEGPAIVLCHGLTASRRYVVHGSRLLPRRGLRTIAYDARGHGESDPAPDDEGYSYEELSTDLGALIGELTSDPVILAGHSMGAHTLTAYALGTPEQVAGVVAIGPAYAGTPLDPESGAYWDRLADGLARGGVEGFIAAYDHDLPPEWRETVLRITRDRLGRHRHPEAVARALREVPRSRPFESLGELEFLDLPALVVASHDDSDPGHPYATAEAWAERLPRAELVSEEPGASPLAWQGGRLSRAIADFCERSEVRERLSGR